jgi:hypothetical protein
VLRKPIVETTEEEFNTMFDVNAKAAFFFIKQAGIDLNDGGKIITLVTSLLAAFTDGYSIYARQGASGGFYSCRSQRVWTARHLGECHWPGADGYSVLLRTGNAGTSRLK